MWKNHFFQLLTADGVTDDRQMASHAAYSPLYAPSPFDVETVTAKLKRYESPSSDNISAELR
jgi:hypothetical protein